ncbi:MAG: sel1 repeat family protein [Clostridiales bacterium]|nr:sel1 repeat family protein [Clostridiales bacterium]
MSADPMELFITSGKLEDFACLRTTWSELCGNVPLMTDVNVSFETQYPMTLEDLEEALENALSLPPAQFLLDWWIPLGKFFYEPLCLHEIMTPAFEELPDTAEPDLPMTAEDLMFWIFVIIAREADMLIGDFFKSNGDNKILVESTINDLFDIDSMLTQINYFREDEEEDLPVLERRFIPEIKENFIMHRDNELVIADLNKENKLLFRRFADELADQNSFVAIKFKAYAYFSGGPVYGQDYSKAAVLLKRLLREFNFGYAANTLGYIYFDGKIDGRPDYEKAYFYFSAATLFDIAESKFKLADMYMQGLYVSQDQEMAYNLINDLYNDERYRFESGNKGSYFPEIAYKMGMFFLNGNGKIPGSDSVNLYGVAYKYLLEARCASLIRSDYGRRPGDDSLMADIQSAIDTAQANLPPMLGDTYTTQAPNLLIEFIRSHSHCLYEINIKEFKKTYKVTITRTFESLDKDQPSKSVISHPWFGTCDYSDHIVFKISKESGFVIDEYVGRNIKFNSINVEDTPGDELMEIVFMDYDNVAAAISTKDLIILRPKDK